MRACEGVCVRVSMGGVCVCPWVSVCVCGGGGKIIKCRSDNSNQYLNHTAYIMCS